MRKVFQFPNLYYHGWFGSYLVVSDETLMAKIQVNKLGDDVSLFVVGHFFTFFYPNISTNDLNHRQLKRLGQKVQIYIP